MILLLLSWRQVSLIISYCDIYMVALQSDPVRDQADCIVQFEGIEW